MSLKKDKQKIIREIFSKAPILRFFDRQSARVENASFCLLLCAVLSRYCHGAPYLAVAGQKL